MYPVPQLLIADPPATLLAKWEAEGLDVDDPSDKGPEGRKCCPKEFVSFLYTLQNAPDFRFDGAPRSNIVRDDYYRLDIQRKGETFSTLAIQTNGQNSKTACNLYVSLDDVDKGWITANVVKEAFRHMFKTRKYQRGGHLTVYRNDAKGTPGYGGVVFMWGRPNGGA